MQRTTRRPRPARLTGLTALAAAGAAAVLMACGGETIAVLGIIGAAGGDFTLDGNPATAALEPVLSDPANPFSDPLKINIQVGNAPGGNPWENLYDSPFGVVVNSGSLGAGNCAGVAGTVDGDRMDLGTCFKGRFANVNRVVSDDGTKVLLFGAFSPTLSSGVWVDIRQRTRRIKFSSNTAGCEFNGSAPTGNAVSLVQVDADLAAGVYNSVQQFTVGGQTWSSGQYVGVSGLRLTGTPGTLELQRERDTAGLACP